MTWSKVKTQGQKVAGVIRGPCAEDVSNFDRRIFALTCLYTSQPPHGSMTCETLVRALFNCRQFHWQLPLRWPAAVIWAPTAGGHPEDWLTARAEHGY